MKTKRTGFLLLLIGIILLTYTGFNLATTNRMVDIGPLKIEAPRNHSVQWQPIAGIVLVLGGVFILSKAKKGKSI